MLAAPFSSGGRQTSTSWRRHADRASRQRSPWCARAPRHRHLTPADPPHVRDGMVGGATRAGDNQRRAVAGEANDAVATRGLNGLGEGHRRPEGDEAACHRRDPPPHPVSEHTPKPAGDQGLPSRKRSDARG
jgi:hypothetical protein